MKKFAILFLAMALAAPTPLWAVGSGGFENSTFSAKQIGMSGAVSAQADEAAAISYNPAGITQLEGIHVQANSAFIGSHTNFKSETLGDTRTPGTLNFVPTAYVTINPGDWLGDRVSFGIGTDSPFGLSTKYKSNHAIGHYTGYDNWLYMYTVKPVAAFKVTDKLSLGAGPVYYRIYDFGGVQAYPNQIGFPGLPDGQVRMNLSGHAWGWQMGALAVPHEKHRVGFYFRSPVNVKLSGLVKVENSSFNGNFETGGWTKMDLPLNYTLAYAYRPSEKTTIETDLGFTRWSVHDRLYLEHDPVNVAADDAILNAIGRNDKDYRNSFSIQAGIDHKLNDKLTLRGGSYFYWTPVPKDHFIPAVPDANRIAFSAGVNYGLTDDIDLGASYMGIMALRRHIDNAVSEGLGTSVDGRYFSYTHDFIFSVTYKWDDVFSRFQSKPEVTMASGQGA